MDNALETVEPWNYIYTVETEKFDDPDEFVEFLKCLRPSPGEAIKQSFTVRFYDRPSVGSHDLGYVCRVELRYSDEVFLSLGDIGMIKKKGGLILRFYRCELDRPKEKKEIPRNDGSILEIPGLTEFDANKWVDILINRVKYYLEAAPGTTQKGQPLSDEEVKRIKVIVKQANEMKKKDPSLKWKDIAREIGKPERTLRSWRHNPKYQ